MAAGLGARPAAAAARLQGGDAALARHAPAAAQADGPHRVPAPAAGAAPALPAPPPPPGTPGGRPGAGAAAPGGAGAPCQPHGGRVPVQLHARRGPGHAAPIPAPAPNPRPLRPQRDHAAAAGAVQAAEAAAAVRVPERAAGERRAEGQGAAESAQGSAPAHPAGRRHRRHHPELQGGGELRPAAVPGAGPGPDGGSPVPAALPDLLPAPAGPCSPHSTAGRAHPTAPGHWESLSWKLGTSSFPHIRDWGGSWTQFSWNHLQLQIKGELQRRLEV